MVLLVFTTAIIIVNAQYKPEKIETQIKEFIHTSSIEIKDHYIDEEGTKIYMAHDIENDSYFKLAIDENGNVEWYDLVKSKHYSKIDHNLQEKLLKMNEDEKVNIIVEILFDYEKIEEHLVKQYPQYFDEIGYKTNLTDEQYDVAREIKTKYIREEMLKNNVLDDKYEVIAISEYSPFMFLNVTKKDLIELEKEKQIYSIGLIPKFRYEENKNDSTNASTTSNVPVNNNSTKAVRADLVKSAGFNGSGIKIGQFEETAPNKNNSYLAGKNITIKSDCKPNIGVAHVNHATEVAGIMIGNIGVAPNAILYSACLQTTIIQPYELAFNNTVNWFISNGVNIINMSGWVQEKCAYTTIERWVDAVTYLNNVTLVKSAGNKNAVNTVNSPGLAYNALTIGNINYTGVDPVSASNSFRASMSSYTAHGYSSVTSKPELSAPGEGANYTNLYPSGFGGTSSATFSLFLLHAVAKNNKHKQTDAHIILFI